MKVEPQKFVQTTVEVTAPGKEGLTIMKCIGVPGPNVGSDWGTEWSGELNNESDKGYEAWDDVADRNPQGEVFVSESLWRVSGTILVQVEKDVVAHEGHEGEK